MIKVLTDSLRSWIVSTDTFTKLQHSYVALSLTSLVIAGLISLINYDLGQSLLFISLMLILIFVANGIVWAVVRTFIVAETNPAKQPSRKK